mgnify:CR=1 FL=1
MNKTGRGQFQKGYKPIFSWLGKKNLKITGELNPSKRLEVREKNSQANKGKHRSPKTEFKKGNKIGQGREHPAWKHGKSVENKEIRKSIEGRLWRESIFKRDKYLCQMPDCDKVERYLEVHHIKKFSLYPELRFSLDNGVTLCKKCHQKTKFKEEKFEKLFIL